MITVLLAVAAISPSSLHEFDAEDVRNFTCVNDTVMGGRSTSKVEAIEDGSLRFSGRLSLENDGGFTSFRSRGVAYEIGESEGVALRVRGDGRRYIFSLDLEGVPLAAGGYWQEFPTERDRWTEVRLPWSKFVPTSFGRPLTGLPEARADRVTGLAVYLYDKQEGPFRVDFDWIRAYGGGAAAASGPETAAQDPGADDGLLPADCSTLATLLAKTGLDAAVAKLEGFTLFAPTDDAFAKLPGEVTAALLRPENEGALKKVLLHHVLAAKVTAWNAATRTSAEALDGGALSIELRGRDLVVGGARVVAPDRLRGKGVVHVVDSVIVPADLVLEETEKPAARLLRTAVERGAPLFNAGAVEACAAVYRTALEALVELGTEELDSTNLERLRLALDQARDQDGRTASWTLRRAIDAVIVGI
jgi:NADH dehydrogenase [ubiquinone] 1 alpha subcomplex assembly factor 1